MSALPNDLRAKVLAAAKKLPSPDARARKRGEAVAIALGLATVLAMLVRLRPQLAGRPAAFVALSAFGWAVLAAIATRFGGRGGSMLGHGRALLVTLAVVVAPATFAWVMGCTLGWPEVREPDGTWAQHLACLGLTSLLSLGPLIALALVRRGLDPVHPRATGAASFAAAGAWGGALIDMHCPLVSAMHVAFGHVAPVVVFAALGALAGVRLFGVSSGDREHPHHVW